MRSGAIGADEGDGEDMFYFTVSSPDPAAAVGLSPESAAWHGRVLFLREWSYERLQKHVNDVISRVEGTDWTAVGEQLSTHMEWEFDAYRET
jgi:hypothetical protein